MIHSHDFYGKTESTALERIDIPDDKVINVSVKKENAWGQTVYIAKVIYKD